MLIQNKKIGLDYDILDRYQAGIVLSGSEVKSVRDKNGSLEGSYVTLRGGEAFLMGMYIPPYQEKNSPAGYNPRQNRKLLLTKKELLILHAIEKQRGLTVVPVSLYNKGRKIKVEIAVVRGKKAHDKRQSIKKKQTDRDIRREYSDR